uniref:Zona pellucida sperm-binding protein 3 n=1 Tax=Echeneis naucrates TaxID=173247 RepID=A0A665USU5_ECHNA
MSHKISRHNVAFELRHPVAASTVSVECRENIAHVKVMKDMFGIGQLINPADLTLGNCAAVAEDPSTQVLIYESELHDCASVLTMTQDSLIYTFTLNYDPQPVGDSPVVRTSKAAVIVECYYPRYHNVSSLPLEPLWIPFSAVKVSEEFLYFTLKLMTDNWQSQRPSYQYYLGNEINIEAEVKQYFHVPLRVFVDHCVATLSTDANSSPRYAFIDNHGCLIDARITGSKSKFMPRTADHKLHLQLEAFRFQGVESGLVCICKSWLIISYFLFSIQCCENYAAITQTFSLFTQIGADAVCGSCESAGLGPVISSGGVGSSSSSSGSFGGGIPGLSTPGRKTRDVAKNEGMVYIKINRLKYFIL